MRVGIWLFASASVAALFAAHPIAAQQVKSPVVGVIRSGSARGAGQLTVLPAAPNGKVLVITQACVLVDNYNANNPSIFLGVVPGVSLAIVAGSLEIDLFQQGCVTFEPGFVVPEGAAVTCNSGHTSFGCAVTAIETVKTP